jgi:hypothetical protein
MNKTTVLPGFLGISRGDTTLNAIIYGVDGEFYFYPVSIEDANEIEDWAMTRTDEDPVGDYCPVFAEMEITDEDMFIHGEVLEDGVAW